MNNKQAPIISKINFDGKDILEIGCGQGSITFEHFQNTKSLLGIDTSKEAIEYMKENWPASQNNSQADFQVGNIVNFKLEDMEFDYVVFSKSF